MDTRTSTVHSLSSPRDLTAFSPLLTDIALLAPSLRRVELLAIGASRVRDDVESLLRGVGVEEVIVSDSETAALMIAVAADQDCGFLHNCHKQEMKKLQRGVYRDVSPMQAHG